MQAATLLLALFAGIATPDASAPDAGPVLVAPPKTNKPGETTHAGGGPAPSVNPDLQGRAALPDSIGDAPLSPPGPPAKPPPAR